MFFVGGIALVAVSMTVGYYILSVKQTDYFRCIRIRISVDTFLLLPPLQEMPPLFPILISMLGRPSWVSFREKSDRS